MRVICPHLELDPATKFCLTYQIDPSYLQVEFIKIDPMDIEAYWRAFDREWDRTLYEGSGGFICVEGDVVPWPGALEEIANCHHGLCNFWAPASWNGTTYNLGFGIGCTKFSAALIQSFPTFMKDIANSKLGRDYHHLDGQVLNGLTQLGVGHHFHSPAVTHINRQKYPVMRDA